MEAQFAPCIRCGGQQVIVGPWSLYPDTMRVTCEGCGLVVSIGRDPVSQDQVLAAWNYAMLTPHLFRCRTCGGKASMRKQDASGGNPAFWWAECACGMRTTTVDDGLRPEHGSPCRAKVARIWNGE